MRIKRDHKFGQIGYNTSTNSFTYSLSKGFEKKPYPTLPLVLNVDLTFRCNMECVHCVARDMASLLGGPDNADLRVTKGLIEKINSSPFMVIVITGGEPLLFDMEQSLINLIKGLKRKAIIIDTNGTIFPSPALLEIFRRKEALIRVSWDIPHPKEEAKLRRYPKGMYKSELECLNTKQSNIKKLVNSGVKVAIQTVLHRNNYNNNNLLIFPRKIKELGINDWYIQRFIPSRRTSRQDIGAREYERRFETIKNICQRTLLRCHYKHDRRHNSVFLLVCDGDLYTQSDTEPGGKIWLGKIDEVDYFAFVSAPDHTDRYIL